MANAPAPLDTVIGRRAAMATLANAPASEIADGLAALGANIAYVELRPVETGLVMLQGRIGGDGAVFNLGEATVTRATVRISSGEVGFSYVLGRDRHKARLAALCDALWQNPSSRESVERHVLAPIKAQQASERARQRAQTAATRVDFFTLVRGED
ncbi:MAG TPA: phosphonate C-P lyase system protein PhnG [Xanthobacteraceae bacterium]|nr:phosphonate C-P lyase system protein PhnG [Xanthobacteraceae bacterium]